VWNSAWIAQAETHFETTIVQFANVISNAPPACNVVSFDEEDEEGDEDNWMARLTSSADEEEDAKEDEIHETGAHDIEGDDLEGDEIEEAECEEESSKEDLREFMRLHSSFLSANYAGAFERLQGLSLQKLLTLPVYKGIYCTAE
jgi:hypothetical protein